MTCLGKFDFCDYKCATENFQYKSNKGNRPEEIQISVYETRPFLEKCTYYIVKLKPGVLINRIDINC